MKQIVIQPVTRIEGHAKITIQLDEQGNVADTRVNVVELRGFERFAIGRPVEELPRIVPRICGVCPWAHHLASSKACDAVFGVDVPSVAKKLRELAYMGHFIHSHVLHFFILSGADFVIGPDADYSVRNVIGIVQKVPEIAKQVVKVRYLGQMMTQTLGGKAIHPDVSVPGGWSKPVTKEEVESLKGMAKECLDFATFAIDFAKKEIFPKYLDVVKSLATIETGFLGTVKNGELNLYDGDLRMMTPDGKYEEFPAEKYLDYIGEHVEPWSYLKFPYYKKMGQFSMDLNHPVGIYRTNALARINVCDRIPTPLAQKELEEFRGTFGRPAQPTLLYQWARLIELVYCAERAVELLNDPELTDPDTRQAVTPCAGHGVGVVEAPRGTLIHDYETDEKGLVTNCNIIVGTTHNNAAINMSVKRAATDLIKNGVYDQGLLNKVEMSIRAYDPCFSCATHELDGRIAVKIDILNAAGEMIDTLAN
ncbi:MAG TPA: Ni/Fe hydrogenase subunit alpha [Dehalococcoidia bacterium]|nr:Ni/Fe hydrogenase subunit alpha [Dehalococcoidia bacterium]